jgi:hypothetical protein
MKPDNYDCFLAKIRQEVVHLTATINYLTTVRDELVENLAQEEKQ